MAPIVDAHGQPSHETSPADDPLRRRASGIVESIGKTRDFLLVVGSFLYIVGYGTWSYIAWRRGFGSLPLIDSQYLIAGIAPTIVLAITVAGIYLLHQLLHVRLTGWLQRCSLRNLYLFHALAWLVAAVGAAIMWASSLEGGSTLTTAFVAGSVLLFGGVLAFDLEVLFQRTTLALTAKLPGTQDFDSHRKWIGELRWLVETVWLRLTSSRRIVFLIPVALAGFVLWQYAEYGYTSLPQALGGAAPRCVQFDVARKDFSPPTLAKIGVLPMSAQDSADVSTTGRLNLHLASGDYLLVSRDADSRGKTALIQLPKSAAKAMSWCD